MKRREVEIRSLATFDEMLACARLQEEIWGPQDVVPATFLTALQKGGGVVGGAFGSAGELVGTVFGLSGLRGGKLIHWSHMLGVTKSWRGRGLGLRLKLFQREQVLRMGIQTMHWTVDPLEARNAQLNLNELGAGVDEYVRDVYGTGADNRLHDVVGTDRLIVTWLLDSKRVEEAIMGISPSRPIDEDQSPIVSSATQPGGTIVPSEELLADTQNVRVEIPPDIQTLKRKSPDQAGLWRQVTRRAFEHYMARGYTVTGFYREAGTDRCFYSLTRSGSRNGENS